jgi:glutamyl-tRNA synthetase
MSNSPSRPVRTRFAPSPTGFLHIGNVRSGLFGWLYARHHGGQSLLRIEDTDLERSEDRFTQDIFDSLKWLGIDWDEEPIFQSKRMDVYRRQADELIAKGYAYRCTCSEEDVERMREKAIAEGRKPMYDRTCREKGIAADVGRPYVIRCKVPLDGYVEFKDLLRGTIRVENVEVDDFVLIRSNGAPTYNMSCVVDDAHTRMTHIIRGDDHINNTPKQIHLYHFMGFEKPEFAHLPMVLGPDKKKLSKRHGAVAVNLYRAEGYLPETMLNFLARLGWSHGDQEVFSVEELVKFFDFDHVQNSSGVFNAEKLLWLNGEHIRRAEPARLTRIVAEDFGSMIAPPARLDRVCTELGTRLVALIQPKVKLVKEIADQLVPLVTPGTVAVDASGLKWNKDANLKAASQSAIAHIADRLAERMKGVAPRARTGADTAWGDSPSLGDAGMSHEDIDAFIRQMATEHGLKLGDLAPPMRLTVTGRMVSAGLFDLMAVLPWDVVEPRLRQAAKR